MPALTPRTANIFKSVTGLECIREYTLVGGTALSLQIENRLSEDLDFMRWTGIRSAKAEVNWVKIQKELKTIGEIESFEIFEFNHVQFVVSGVKFSFYITDKNSPVSTPVVFTGNLVLADLQAIAAMKMEVLLRRSNFRDYYDIYCLLNHGINFKSAVESALRYSNHLLSTKNLLAILSDGSRFRMDSSFQHLNPVYHVSAFEIESYIKECIKRNYAAS